MHQGYHHTEQKPDGESIAPSIGDKANADGEGIAQAIGDGASANVNVLKLGRGCNVEIGRIMKVTVFLYCC